MLVLQQMDTSNNGALDNGSRRIWELLFWMRLSTAAFLCDEKNTLPFRLPDGR